MPASPFVNLLFGINNQLTLRGNGSKTRVQRQLALATTLGCVMIPNGQCQRSTGAA
jgi:hypothetical protein